MGFLPLSFGLPAVLIGLLALPVIWWLLRLTPPRPQEEVFPPLRILARVLKSEETPHQSPWWLTLLRLLMAALIIFALAEPVLNQREVATTNGSALAIVMDNGWSTAPDWDVRVATAERLVADASDAGQPVVLAFTAGLTNAEIGPFDAAAAREHLAAAKPEPVPVNRAPIYARVAQALEDLPGASVAVLSDGLESAGDEAAFSALFAGNVTSLTWIVPSGVNLVGLASSDNPAEALTVTAIRATSDTLPRQVTLGGYDNQGRRIAETTATFDAGEAQTVAQFRVPFELRNDFVSVSVDGQPQAAAVRLLDENSKRRRVGLISQAETEGAQPLLSPLYYIRRAMEPFSDLVEASNADLSTAIPEILAQRPAMIVMADVGTIPDAARDELIAWLNDGGTLVRFAGSRLAAAGNDEELLPVRLRIGERALGGTLSWTEPQPVTEFPATGPFADLAPPSEVTVSRQVLAEPTSDLADLTWANLADGTPLVTGATRGDGTLVLFHITPEATWSNLPISGSFVEMLRRIVQLSRNQGRIDAGADGSMAASLLPYRMISAEGLLVPPGPDARPLSLADGAPAVTIENPPGFYGTEEGFVAHNLLPADTVLTPIAKPQTTLPITEATYAFDEAVDLKGPLIALAIALMLLDTLAVLWMGGVLARRPRAAASSMAVLALSLSALMLASGAGPATAQDRQTGDDVAIQAISQTRIAYVITGNSSIDNVSRAGLLGLTRYLIDKTALEPGEPAGVDIESDELAFYPLIYWPIDPGAPLPSEQALGHVDAYMRQGGTVLFDTRDQFSTGFDAGSTSPATQRLRQILSAMNVPSLEPVPADHVLTKTFFIMPDFPGRYSGSPLWVEASLDAQRTEDRPVRTGDGVTPIMITANDLAGAWALDASGFPMFPTVPADPMQRIYAYRAGVNIMMYMLTGNYKSDQVHVPALLERLGQ